MGQSRSGEYFRASLVDAVRFLRDIVPRDGVKPPPPAFSGPPKSAKSVILRNLREQKGTLRSALGSLMFIYCSFATGVNPSGETVLMGTLCPFLIEPSLNLLAGEGVRGRGRRCLWPPPAPWSVLTRRQAFKPGSCGTLPLPLAKRGCRALDRKLPPRRARPCHRYGRAASEATSGRLHSLFPRRSHPPRIEQGDAG